MIIVIGKNNKIKVFFSAKIHFCMLIEIGSVLNWFEKIEKGKSLRESEGTGGGDPACRFNRLWRAGRRSNLPAWSRLSRWKIASVVPCLPAGRLLRNDPSLSFPFFQTNLSVIRNYLRYC